MMSYNLNVRPMLELDTEARLALDELHDNFHELLAARLAGAGISRPGTIRAVSMDGEFEESGNLYTAELKVKSSDQGAVHAESLSDSLPVGVSGSLITRQYEGTPQGGARLRASNWILAMTFEDGDVTPLQLPNEDQVGRLTTEDVQLAALIANQVFTEGRPEDIRIYVTE